MVEVFKNHKSQNQKSQSRSKNYTVTLSGLLDKKIYMKSIIINWRKMFSKSETFFHYENKFSRLLLWQTIFLAVLQEYFALALFARIRFNFFWIYRNAQHTLSTLLPQTSLPIFCNQIFYAHQTFWNTFEMSQKLPKGRNTLWLSLTRITSTRKGKDNQN